MEHTWADDEAKASHERAVAALVALATNLAEGRDVTPDSAMAHEVRREDALMWARHGSQESAS